METIVQIAQLVLALSILVGIHEAGHMISARIFGMRVEKFFIGFPPKIFGFKKGETEYGLGAIPLGGFVKISGMIDESMDKEQMAQEPKPWEFRTKPAWQRLIVMLGGIIVNIAAGILIYISLTYKHGDTFIASDVIKEHGIVAYEYAQEVGFQSGDKIIKINGEDYERFRQIWSGTTLLQSNGSWTVDRNGEIIDIPIPGKFVNKLEDKEFEAKFMDFNRPFKVGEIRAGMSAEAAGMLAGDKIVKVGEDTVVYFQSFREALAKNIGQTVSIQVVRNNEIETLDVLVNENGAVGFVVDYQFEVSRKDYAFGEAVTGGTERAFTSVILNFKAIGKMFSGDIPARSISGPIGIVEFYPKKWDWDVFWERTGFISMVLAFMNLLPIPALDGGHVVFLLYEMISGKAPSDKFLENAQKVGMVMILALMVFVLGNDILKLFGL